MKKQKAIRAWHFVGDTLRDGSPVPRDGVWLKHSGLVVICESGLHASRDPFDALRYAPGATLCLVECRGTVVEQADKLVCSERRIVVRMEATEMLRYFARMQALSVIDNYPNGTDDAVFDWLMVGDEAARSAAAESAATAESAAARSAAILERASAWSARAAAAESARAAAWSARAAAAESAAMSAAESAAMSAARSAWAAAGSAWAAMSAESAARSAAWAAVRADFNQTVYNCFADYLD